MIWDHYNNMNTTPLTWLETLHTSYLPPSAPLVPRFTVTRLTATEISVDIEPLTLSEERRGEITSYHVLWKQKPQNTLNCGTITNAQIKSSLNTSLILLNLDPWQEYCVTVSAETSAGVGNHSTATVVECKH